NNSNFIPDCDLRNPNPQSPATTGSADTCGVYQNLNYGNTAPTTIWANDVTSGFGVRDGLWDIATEVQHELTHAISMTAGYYYNWAFGQRVVDNVDLTPQDYSPYSVLAPANPRLPGGGGNVVGGFYDLSPTKVGQVHNLVESASKYGHPYTHNHFISVNF